MKQASILHTIANKIRLSDASVDEKVEYGPMLQSCCIAGDVASRSTGATDDGQTILAFTSRESAQI
jgi:hypothetical protein